MRICFSALLLALVCATPGLGAQAMDPAAVAERRLAEFAALLDSGDRGAAREFARGQMVPPDGDGAWIERFGDLISGLHDRTRGVEVFEVQQILPTRLVAKFRARLSGNWEAIDLRLEDEPPYRIANHIIYGPVDAPSAEPDLLPRSDAELAEMTASLLQRLAEAEVFSGVVLLASGDRVLFHAAFGEAERARGIPNTNGTCFNLASLDKMFTAVAVAQLAERARLSVDDPLEKFLPGLPTPEAAKQIRIEHLLTHTSGLGDFMTAEWHSAPHGTHRTLEDFLSLLKGQTPAFEPGSRMRYSNAGYLILGRVIEVVTGQEYHAYVRQHVFTPAGMERTGPLDVDALPSDAAVGYQKEYADGGVTFAENTRAIPVRGGPAGGGYSTAEDLFRFTRALRDGRLLGAGMLQRVLSPKPELGARENGYGFLVDTRRGVAAHGGGIRGVSNAVQFPLDRGHALIVLSNFGGGRTVVVDRLLTWLNGMPDPAPATARSVP
jgi:CubicO group peptidase (beta-lactamase class C family)